eukprot:1199388-Pyramimonas_sp.AAC.1
MHVDEDEAVLVSLGEAIVEGGDSVACADAQMANAVGPLRGEAASLEQCRAVPTQQGTGEDATDEEDEL